MLYMYLVTLFCLRLNVIGQNASRVCRLTTIKVGVLNIIFIDFQYGFDPPQNTYMVCLFRFCLILPKTASNNHVTRILYRSVWIYQVKLIALFKISREKMWITESHFEINLKNVKNNYSLLNLTMSMHLFYK